MDDLHIHDLFESLLSLNIKVLKYFYRFESLIHSLSQVEEETKNIVICDLDDQFYN